MPQHRRSPHVPVLVAALALAFAACTQTVEEPPKTRRYTFVSINGISMGAVGAAYLAGFGDNHEKFDAVGALGGPMDAAYFLDAMERQQIGGFCPLSRLEALATTDPDALNDPAALDCTKPGPTVAYENPQQFNSWRYTANGGDFDRSSYLNIFHDLALGHGNPFAHNPGSAFFPHPSVTRADYERADFCTNPVVIEGVYNREYNPEGKYKAITFCDGEEPVWYCEDEAKTPYSYCNEQTPEAFCAAKGVAAKRLRSDDIPKFPHLAALLGKLDPCYSHDKPLGIGLAVDLNGNKRRDYHEPVILNGHERFQDTGAADDPHPGAFDLLTNPLATAGNRQWDPGEPFDDFGLDGVAGTGDFGENNGKYDDSPSRARFFAHDFRQKYKQLTPAQRGRIDFYADGGIRDVFNLGVSADHLTSAMRGLEPTRSTRYVNFLDIPTVPGQLYEGDFYTSTIVDFSKFGSNVFLRYGNPNATATEAYNGDGDHVGNYLQVIQRFETFIRWTSHRWTPVLGEPDRARGLGKRKTVTYDSAVLGTKGQFTLGLPPGYEEDTERKYPVVLLMHGYGMEAGDMGELSVLFDTYMNNGDILPMILAYPSGRCCFTKPDGTKDCREKDDEGKELGETAENGYKRECAKGTFYVNRQGYEPGDETRYGDQVLEIVDHIRANYRVLEPRDVPIE